jgi:hypothetical protein
MQFKQTNNNAGDVNNAITGKGNIAQTTGARNKIEVNQPKECFWSTLWRKVKDCWKWITG